MGVVRRVSAEELLSRSVDSILPEPPMEPASLEESLVTVSVLAATTSELLLILLMILFVFH